MCRINGHFSYLSANTNTVRKADLSLTCEITGKPITKTNKYGMFCEDMCELEQCKLAEKKGSELINSFINMFNSG